MFPLKSTLQPVILAAMCWAFSLSQGLLDRGGVSSAKATGGTEIRLSPPYQRSFNGMPTLPLEYQKMSVITSAGQQVLELAIWLVKNQSHCSY